MSAIALGIGIIWFMKKTTEPEPNFSVFPTENTIQQNQVATEIVTSGPRETAQLKNTSESTATASAAPIDDAIKTRLAAIQQRRPELNVSPANVIRMMQRPDAWSVAASIPKKLPLQPNEFNDGREFIQLEPLKIETLLPGDLLELPIQEERKTYRVKIDEVVIQNSDTISWYGHIEGADGQNYSVSITRGKQLMVGGLDTPEGHFVLQAYGTDGWIASSQTLFKINPAVSDNAYPNNKGAP